MLPVDLQNEQFEKIVQPILLYGSEILGFRKPGRVSGNCSDISKDNFKYEKYTHFLVYGETGVYPIYTDIYCRMISFWATLVSGPPYKIFYIVYRTPYSLYTFENNNNNEFIWFKTLKDILCNCGFSGIWDKHLFPDKK